MTRPLLTLLPGLDGTGRLFTPLIEALDGAADTHVISYPNLDTPADYVASVAAELPTDRPSVLVAESFSGPIALELLAARPDRFSGAVLSTTYARPPMGLVVSVAHKLRLSTFVNPLMNEQILRLFCLNGIADLGLIRNIVEVVRPIDRDTIGSRLRAMVQMDGSPHLDAIRCPVLVLTATRDRVVRRRFSESLLVALPDVAHRTIEGPHLLLQAAPVPCAAAIRAFVDARCAPVAGQRPAEA